MTDGNWDSEAPAAKKGMPTWAKISLGCCGGCALVFVLLLATCVGGAHWVSKRAGSLMDKTWAEMDRAVVSLRTEAGTKILYRDNPGLAETYPTEKEFLEEAEVWRTKLGEFPAERPTLEAVIRDPKNASHFNLSTDNNRTRIEYQIPKGGMLHLELESGKLVDLRVE